MSLFFDRLRRCASDDTIIFNQAIQGRRDAATEMHLVLALQQSLLVLFFFSLSLS